MRSCCARVVAVIAFFIAPLMHAASPYVVKEINTNVSPSSSYPDHFVTVGSYVYFTTTDYNGNPIHLWRTDGTDANTIDLGPTSTPVTAFNGRAWYLLSVPSANLFYPDHEIWSTDGTVAGTQKMLLPAGNPAPNPSRLIATQSALYFFSSEIGTASQTIWISNGTTAGTHLLTPTKFQFGYEYYTHVSWAAIGSYLYFAGNSGSGWTIWRTDGVNVAVADPNLTTNMPASLQVMNNVVVYFKPAASLWQVWRTDGTPAGTFAINGPSGAISVNDPFTNILISGSSMYFVGSDTAKKLWRSDGTTAPAVALAASLPGLSATFDGALLARLANGTLIFSAAPMPNASGPSLWSFDGTNTTFLTTMMYGNSQNAATSAGSYAVYGTGPNLWRTDGSIGGTYSLGDISGTDGTHNWPMAVLGTSVLFAARDNTHGFELWKTDGTIPNTGMLKDINIATYGAYPKMMRRLKNGVLFTASSNATDEYNGLRDLWFSDGTDAGTQKVLPAIEYVEDFVQCGGVAFFAHYTAAAGSELWTTDGTAGGTSMLIDTYPGSYLDNNGQNQVGSGYPRGLVCVDNRLYFGAADADGTSLWRSDGTVPGTFKVKQWPGPYYSTAVQYGHGFFFHDGISLWASNGTAEGTFKVKTFANSIGKLAAAGSYAYVTSGNGPTEMWRSNASQAGTTNVLNGGSADLLGQSNGRAIILWQQSATPHGYCSVGDANDITCFDAVLAGSSSFTTSFRTLNGRVYYNKPNVYSTDLNTSFDTGMTASNLFTVAGGRLYMGGNYEGLYETGGTVAATQLLLNNSNVSSAMESGGRLFIAADELYAYDLPVTAVGISPSNVTPGQQVTITGRGFVAPIAVSVGGAAATVGSTTSTSVPFTAPALGLGAYPVTLTTGDGRTFDATELLTYTCTPPTAVINSVPAPVCPLAPAHLSGSGGNCHWYPATGLDNPASCTPTATLASSATYTLVVDNNGCLSTNDPTVTVSVYPPPDPTITISGYNNATHSTGVASVPDAGPGATYAWSASGGVQITGSATLRSITFATDCLPGTLNVTVTNGHGCASTSASANVSINHQPVITNLSTGFIRPGTVVTVTGQNFDCVDRLTLFGTLIQSIPFTTVDPHTIRFTSPVSGPMSSQVQLFSGALSAVSDYYLYWVTRDDFNFDGGTDVVWRAPATGQTLIWANLYDNGTLVTMTPYVRGTGTTDYRIVALNMFGFTPTPDILWQRTSTRELSTTYIRFGVVHHERVWPAIPSATLKVAATGDLDGDGVADVIMRDTQTGATSAWRYDDNGGPVVQTPIHAGNNLDWTIVASRDFDRDGLDDILWRNTTTGMTLLWFMNGTTIRASQTVHGGGNLDWTIAGVGDFNADGYTDILWRHISDGMTLLWTMNGASIQSSTVVHGGSNLDWDVAGVGDFTFDRMADILWRNKNTGMTLYWKMNGPQIVKSVVLHTGGNPEWQIEGPRF